MIGVRIIRMRKAGGALLCKKISLGDDGKPVSDGSPCAMSRGTATRVEIRRGAAVLASPLGDMTDPARLLICEGWATAATLFEETGKPVLAAMNTANLRPVAMAAREWWPGADIIIAADNDRFTRLPDGRQNPGVIYAREAAAAAGARLMVPQFPEGCTGTDYNDLRLARSIAGRAAA